MFGALADELAVEVAVYQTGEVIHLGLDVGHFVEAERVALAERGAGAFLLVCGKILVADGAGMCGRLPVQVGLDALEALVYVGLLGIQLAEDGSLCAAACGRPAGRDDRAAYLAAFVAEIINVVVERNRTDHQYVIFFFHFFFPAHTPVRNSFLKILQGTEMCLHVFATGLYNSILSFYHKTWLNTIKYLENVLRKRVRHVKKRVLCTGGRSGKDRRACAAARNMVCCYCYKRKST